MYVLLRATFAYILGRPRNVFRGSYVAAHLEPVFTGYLQVENLMGDYADLEHTTRFMRLQLLVVLPVWDDRPHCLLPYDIEPIVAATLLRWHRSILYKQKF